MSFTARRMSLINSIAGAYSTQLRSQSSSTVSKSNVSIALSNISCGGTDCSKCVKSFVNEKIIENPTPEEVELIKYITVENCAGSCVCNIDNVNVSENILLDESATIKPSSFDLAKMAKQIQDSMNAKYGSTSDEFGINVTKILTSINIKTTQNISQSVIVVSVVESKGGGVNMKNVTTKSVTNAVMNAIAESCSKPGTCPINLLNNLVNSDMEKIQEEVDKDITGGFSNVWKHIKKDVIIAGIIMGSLLLLIISLLVFRAYKSG
jgi:hypothetical protein